MTERNYDMMQIDRDAVKGELPDDIFDAIEWWRLAWYTRETILAQHHEARSAILGSAAEHDENGPLVDLAVHPFDAEGFTLIRFQGQPLLRLHVSRLLKGVPLELEPLPPAVP